jgi:hypothetical protein
MQVWSFEADQIQPDDQLRPSDIVSNEAIDEFLRNRNDANKFFLVAPKGLGKTLILKVKSKSIRAEGKSGFHCIPEGPLVEKVVIEQTSLSFEDFAQFEKFSVWQKIWKVCLTLTICKNLGLPLPEAFENKLKKAKDISPILNIIINDWKFFLHKSHQEFASEIAPYLREIQSQVAMFIDSFDQTLGHLIKGQSYSSTEEKKRQNAVNLWANAQLGLLYAIQEICVQHRHIKIFASVRQEAFEMDESDMHLQIEDFTTKISYSKNELRQIFINNIQRTEGIKLVNQLEKNPFIKFCGIEKIPHSFVPNYNEDVFDFIYRHTFGRPRELVLIGKRIFEMHPDDRNIKSIRGKVNRVSHHEIFEQFKKEIIPSFNERRLKTFLNDLKYNVFTKDEANELDQNQFRFYYKLGLIGSLKKDYSNHEYYQEFREANKFNYKFTIDIPNSDFFFTHPAMDDLLITQLNKKYHELNVIGYKYPFIPPKLKKSTPKKISCCHFGVGNLGRGLVLPYLTKMSCRIALINRESESWTTVISSGIKEVILSDTNGNEASFRIVHDSLSKTEIDLLISEWCANKIDRILLITENIRLIKKVAEASSFITTALKFPAAIKWCSSILLTTTFKRRTTIYPFENERDLVKLLREELKSNKNIEIKEVIADRICSEKEIRIENNKAIIHTTCENYSLVIVNDKRHNNPFNSSKLVKGLEIQLAKSSKEFNFYHDRKLWLFNCVHAVLSCYCYNHLKTKSIPIDKWEEQYIHILKDINTINTKIERISQAIILRFLSDLDANLKTSIFPGSTNKEVFGDLFKYAQDILDRISSNRDQLIRVLPLEDFETKYESRIQELIKFYNNDNDYQALKSLQIFDDQNTYKDIRRSVLDLQSNLMSLSIDILRKEKKSNPRQKN